MSIAAIAGVHEQAQSMSEKLVEWRRALHRYPELSFHEHRTMAFIAEQLQAIGLQAETGVGGTGVVAEIGNPESEHIVALRADMDALPISEANDCQYASNNSGVMHACGHDAHVACLLGAARILAQHHSRSPLPGRVRLLFQPAEESVNADNKSGATLLIEAGALKDVAALVGLHVFPMIPAGSVALRSGPVLAACDSFDAEIRGRGCHGAQPELGVDSIVLASQVVQQIQTVISRKVAATDTALVTVGGIRSSSYAPNVVAEAVEITGTVRYVEPRLHHVLREEIQRCLKAVEPLGGSYKLDYRHETPALVNDPQTTAVVSAAARELLGAEHVVEMQPMLGADDFSFYTEHAKCCYFALGAGIAGSESKFHSPGFDIDESCLPVGSALLAASAVRLLNSL
jgi:amidohydrolase